LMMSGKTARKGDISQTWGQYAINLLHNFLTMRNLPCFLIITYLSRNWITDVTLWSVGRQFLRKAIISKTPMEARTSVRMPWAIKSLKSPSIQNPWNTVTRQKSVAIRQIIASKLLSSVCNTWAPVLEVKQSDNTHATLVISVFLASFSHFFISFRWSFFLELFCPFYSG